MRILLASALLGWTASCAWAPPEAAAPAAVLAPPVALAPAPPLAAPPAVAAAAPVPPPAAIAAPAAPAVDYAALPWLVLRGPPPAAGRLMLNNFSFEAARVQAVLASGPDCAIGPAAAIADFVLPPNATKVIPTPPGMDVCWRRELPEAAAQNAPPAPPWSAWNRAFTGPGRFLDTVL